MPASQAPTEPRPQTLPELFWAFTGMALQGFGGVLAVAQVPLLWLLAAGGDLGWFGLI